MNRRGLFRIVGVIAATALLAGCQTTPDGGFALVRDTTVTGFGQEPTRVRSDADAKEARERVAVLLRRPLSADAAVQVALLNNRGLQAAYNELGLAEAQKWQASLPPNPTISLSRLSGPLEIEIEKRIVGNILALATLPARAEIAAERFRQAQWRAAEATLQTAAQARRAYYRAVASRELIGFLTKAQAAAESAAQLARRLGESGAMNKLDQARDQVFYADLTGDLARARQRAATERERLIRALGLWGGDLDFRLAEALPALPSRPRNLPDVEVEALRRRVDVQVARIDVETLARFHGLTQATRFINLLDVAGVHKTKRDRDSGEAVRDRGIDVEFQIPLFDFGEARLQQAEESYRQAVNRLAEKAVNVRSEARQAYLAYRASYDIAAHYRREVLPLRKIISDETLLRYNAMQIDVFALLAEARQRIAATTAAIEAVRDFWLADIELQVAVIGGGADDGAGDAARSVAAAADGAAGH